MAIPKLLSIAGSDPSGGAGVQADLKTFSALGCYGMAVVTALTAQNTTGVTRVFPIPPDMVAAQIDAIFSDIAVNAVKIGMLAEPAIAEAVAESLRRAGAKNIVLDPVLAATRGAALSEGGLPGAIIKHLLPLVDLITPNLAEAAVLTGTSLARDTDEMAAQARALVERGARAALVKGGHLGGEPTDVLFANGAPRLCSRDGASTRATRTAPAARWPRPSPRISRRDRPWRGGRAAPRHGWSRPSRRERPYNLAPAPARRIIFGSCGASRKRPAPISKKRFLLARRARSSILGRKTG